MLRVVRISRESVGSFAVLGDGNESGVLQLELIPNWRSLLVQYWR